MSACGSAYVAGLAGTMRTPAHSHGKDRDASYSRQLVKQAVYQSAAIASLAIPIDSFGSA